MKQITQDQPFVGPNTPTQHQHSAQMQYHTGPYNVTADFRLNRRRITKSGSEFGRRKKKARACVNVKKKNKCLL